MNNMALLAPFFTKYCVCRWGRSDWPAAQSYKIHFCVSQIKFGEIAMTLMKLPLLRQFKKTHILDIAKHTEIAENTERVGNGFAASNAAS